MPKSNKLEVAQWIKENQGKHFCQCETKCGIPIVIRPHHRLRGIAKYIRGHHPAYIRTEEIRANYREAFKDRSSHPNSTKGKTLKEIHGEEKAENLSRNWSEKRKGKKQSKEIRDKKSITMKKRVAEGVGNFGNMCGRKSGYEKIVEAVIKENGFEFRSVGQKGLFLRSMGKNINPDFVHKDRLKKIAIESYGRHFKELGYGSESNWLRQRFDLYHNIGWDALFLNDEDIADVEVIKQKISNFVEFYN